jgi:hypothetical protein
MPSGACKSLPFVITAAITTRFSSGPSAVYIIGSIAEGIRSFLHRTIIRRAIGS